MKEFEYLGEWCLPSAKENKLPGVLKFSEEDGLTLELLGAFEKDEEDFHDNIIGETYAKPISLFSCLKITINTTIKSSPYPKRTYQIYSIRYAFLGGLFDKPLESLKFRKYEVKYTFLSEWGKLSKIKTNTDDNSIEDNSYGFELNLGEDLIINWKDKKIIINQRYSLKNKIIKTLLETSCSFIIETDTPKTLTELEKQLIFPLRNLLDIVTNQANYIKELTILLDNESQEEIYVIGHQNLVNIQTEYRINKALFPLQPFKNKFKDIVRTWLDLTEKISWLIDLYCYVQYHSSEIGDTARFIFMWQCLEGYYKNIISQNPNSSSEQIIKYFLENNNSLLESLLSYNSKKNDTKSLKKLISKYQEKLTKKIVATRNLYTHHFDEGKEKLEGEQIFRVAWLMSFIFLSTVLKKLDFEEQEIIFILKKQSSWIYLQEIFTHLKLLE